jgi:hypothetical protein
LLPCTFCCCITDGNSKCQLRLLDNFTIHEAGRPHAFVALEALRSSSRPVATGELLPAKSADAGAAWKHTPAYSATAVALDQL